MYHAVIPIKHVPMFLTLLVYLPPSDSAFVQSEVSVGTVQPGDTETGTAAHSQSQASKSRAET